MFLLMPGLADVVERVLAAVGVGGGGGRGGPAQGLELPAELLFSPTQAPWLTGSLVSSCPS